MVSPDGVAPSRMVSVSASVNLPLHHKVQKFSSGTGSPGWSRKKGRKMVVVWCGTIITIVRLQNMQFQPMMSTKKLLHSNIPLLLKRQRFFKFSRVLKL